jgi:hypothetical protein
MIKFIYGIFFDTKEEVERIEITPLSFITSIMIAITTLVVLFKGDMVIIKMMKHMIMFIITYVGVK